jgi:predicted mannosyl-3-phosphoglycerate phosphatase (HAD superfamily)
MKSISFYTLLSLIILFTVSVSAQSKKDIRNNKIVSELCTISVTENGKDISYKDSYTVYDKNGNIVEQTEFNRDGSIKFKEINKYDAKKNKIEKTEYSDKDKKTIKTTYGYNANDDKVMETEYDNTGAIYRQSVFLYNNKGFKTEKRTIDGNKKLIAIKKYIYSAR